MPSTRKFLLTALTIAMAAVAAMAVALYEVAFHTRESSDLVESAHAVLMAISEAEQQVEALSHAVHVKQDEPGGAARTQQAEAAALEAVRELRQLLARDAVQPPQAAGLLHDTVAAIGELAHDHVDPANAPATRAHQASEEAATRARTALAALEGLELQLLDARRAQQREASQRVLWMLAAIGAVSALGIVWVYRAHNRQAQRLARSERRFGRLVQGLPVSLWQLRHAPGGEPAFDFVSDNAPALLGVRGGGAVRLSLDRIQANILEEDRPAYARALAQACATLAPWHADFRVHGSGGPRWIRSRATAQVEDSGEVLWNGYWADVTAEIELEQALARATEEARRASEAKSSFLASVSHEIRTPMNGMLGMLELFDLTALGADQRDMLQVIRGSARSLLLIVNDLLDFSKIEAGKLALNPAADSVREVVQATAEIYRSAASAKGLSLSVTVDEALAPRHVFDALRLTQILNNLVANAVKFTAAGEVAIGVAVQPGGGPGAQALRLTVRDSGVGMAPEVLARLFQPYEQAGSDTAARFGGTGLGLAICQRLAQLMGGVIRLDSTPGAGTTATLDLVLATAEAGEAPALRRELPAPLPLADDPALAALSAADAAPQAPLLLIVDDHPTNRLLIKRQVELLGYAAETAADGEEALHKWSAGRYAAVLADCNMPRMDGYALAAFIRDAESRQGRDRTPIVACTANALAAATEKCLAAGMDDYLVKPVQLEAIARCLARWVPLQDIPDGPPVLAGHALDEVCGSDALLRAGILGEFAQVHERDCQALQAAVAAADWGQAQVQAHRIRGSCRMVGATALSDLCERIELLAEAGDAAALREALRSLAHENDRLAQALASETTP